MSTDAWIRCKDHPGTYIYDDQNIRASYCKSLAFLCENRRRFAAVFDLLEEMPHADPYGLEVSLCVGFANEKPFPWDILRHMDCTLQVVTEYGEVLSEHPPKP